MSFPILYEPTETNFSSMGLGSLNDTLSCLVKESKNGIFELEMTYPTTGMHYQQIKTDYLLKVDTGHRSQSKNQRFRIKRIDKSMDGFIRIFAQHISYLAQELPFAPVFHVNQVNASRALEIWRDAIADKQHPFQTSSNINQFNSTRLSVGEFNNPRQILGGVSGSILDRWGGEYLFDNYHIHLLEQRGANSNTLIAYGRNLTDLSQEENIAQTFTSIYPFARFEDEGKQEIITLPPPYVVDSKYVHNYPNRRVLPLDFTREFERGKRPDLDKLKSLAEAYIEKHGIGIPRVTLSISFVDLTKMLMDQNHPYEQINLCDYVLVRFEKLEIETRAQVTQIEWNVLRDRYERLYIGDLRPTLSDNIRKMEREISNAEVSSNDALTAANGKNTIFFSPDRPEGSRAGDLWYRPNGDDLELWIFRDGGWDFVMSALRGERISSRIDEALTNAQNSLDRANEAIENIDLNDDGIAARVISSEDFKSQITQLENQINLRVTGSNLINQINLSEDGISIDGSRINITGETFIEEAVIADAHIQNVSADKLSAGTIDARHIRLMHLDAGAITTGQLNAIDIMGAYINGGRIEGTQIVGQGLVVHHPTMDGQTILSPTEFAGYYGTGNNRHNVFRVNRDIFDMQNANIRKSLTVGDIASLRTSATERQLIANLGNVQITRRETGIAFM